MIGRTNVGGGGGGLNFKVVGNPQPTNPSENTIWINTDTPITSYVFSATQPESPVDGMVWINTGRTSNVAFNALKKNAVMVYPQGLMQYISVAWVYKDSYIYQNGKFGELRNGMLYLSGDEYEYITGGWLFSVDYSGTNNGCLDFTGNSATMSRQKNADNITLETYRTNSPANSCAACSVSTSNKIDLSEYKKIRLVYEATGNLETSTSGAWRCYFAVASESPIGKHGQTFYESKVIAVAHITQNSTSVDIDVSSVSEGYLMVVNAVYGNITRTQKLVIKEIQCLHS